LSLHFGRTPWFVVFDNETGEMKTVPNEPEELRETHCVSVERLKRLGIDAVVCGGMGKRSLANFEDGGMAVFLSKKVRVWEVLCEIQAGAVKRLRSENACESGHHHD
jgi:predicted Fe-Mo cluster-binding NifX family protein